MHGTQFQGYMLADTTCVGDSGWTQVPGQNAAKPVPRNRQVTAV